jgi:ubiquinone/menaquinone biosynthesis C-methylase UbiE
MTAELPSVPLNLLVARHFDGLAESYDQKAANRINYLGRIDDIAVDHVARSGLEKPMILDVGTGTGTRLAGLKQRLPNADMFASDVSSKMLAQAKEKDIDGLVLADMSHLPIKDGVFDYVFCFFNAFGYVPSQEQRAESLNEFNRVLKPGGTVIIDVLNRWHTGEGINFKKSKRQVSRELAVSRQEESLEEGDVLFNLQMNGDVLPGYFHSFTKRETDSLFKHAGFHIEDFQIVGYDSGITHTEINRGNFLYVLRKPQA